MRQTMEQQMYNESPKQDITMKHQMYNESPKEDIETKFQEIPN